MYVRFIYYATYVLNICIKRAHAGIYDTHVEAQLLRLSLLKNTDFNQLSVNDRARQHN